MVQNGQAVDVPHRHDRPGKAVIRPGRRRAFLAFDGHLIGHVAGETVFRGDDVGADALRHEIVVKGDLRVDGNRAAIGAHRHAAHAFHAAGDIGHARAATHLVGGHVHRLEARGTEPVDADARHTFVVIRRQNSGPRKAGALFADLGHVAPDHVLDGACVQIVAILDGVQRNGRQTRGRDFVQAAILAALAANGAGGVIDIGFSHGGSPQAVARSLGLPGIMS